MSEPATTVQAPTVYFIDDSATMREVIKIAFRKEYINVVTCSNAAAALEEFQKTRPDAVISDVIMPDKDGYELCSFIKQDAGLGSTPVILMSGVVNRQVAEKAMAVKADELLRKPFQPQELISRVKSLLKIGESPIGENGSKPAHALSGLFGGGAAPAQAPNAASTASAATSASKGASTAAPASPSNRQAPAGVAPPVVPATQPRPAGAPPVARPATPAAAGQGATSSAAAGGNTSAAAPDVQRLRFEIQRLYLLVKKLQSELEAERQYCMALESHIRTMQEGA
jgi:CheY-like chemotaxis protein